MQNEVFLMLTLRILRLTGAKTQEFLQGQFTCDMGPLINHGDFSLAACCDHRGRMVANFWVVRWKDDYLLVLPEKMRDIVQAHLQKYSVFSRVSIEQENG